MIRTEPFNIFKIGVSVSIIILVLSLGGLSARPVQHKSRNKHVQSSIHELKSKIAELQEDLKQVKAGQKEGKSSGKVHTQILIKIKGIFSFVFDQMKFLVDKSDKIISKKFFIAAMLLLGPPLAIYCKYFNPTLISKTTKRITGATVDKGMDVAIDVTEEVVDKTTDKILNNPKTLAKIFGTWLVFSTVASVATETIKAIGLKVGPFIAAKAGTLITGAASTMALHGLAILRWVVNF